MADFDNKRNEKGQFVPGVSGNPTGQRKDGQPRAPKPSPVGEMRELLEIAKYNDDVQAVVAPALGALLTMQQGYILQLSFNRASKDNRILAILLQHTLTNLDKHNAKNKDNTPKDLNQLTLELEELKQNQHTRDVFANAGIDIESFNVLEMARNIEALQNPLSLLTVPAQAPENSKVDQENTAQIPEKNEPKKEN